MLGKCLICAETIFTGSAIFPQFTLVTTFPEVFSCFWPCPWQNLCVLDNVFLLNVVFNDFQTEYNFKILTFHIFDLSCFKESQFGFSGELRLTGCIFIPALDLIKITYSFIYRNFFRKLLF
jgi:hypothetical protein